MSSFATHRRRVRDPALPLQRRMSNLRSCILCFAPYGFRAIYHHLTISARIPRDLTADPQSLVRAVEELHEARQLWLVGLERYAQRRRAEKRAGRRTASPSDPWRYAYQHVIAPSPDPQRHPAIPLPDFIRRQLAIADGAALAGCPYCGDLHAPVSHSTGHGFTDYCRTCGMVTRPCPCGQCRTPDQDGRDWWPSIWQRAHMGNDGLPSPHWPGHRHTWPNAPTP